MKIPENSQYVLFGGTFVLANKMQYVADRKVGGLSTKQWFLLRTLQDMPSEPAPTITSLARETDTTRQNTAKMLEILRRQGYVILKNNPHDHRSSIVELTGQGKRTLGVMAAESEAFFRELFKDIDDQDCETAAKVLIQMVSALNKMQEEMQ